MIKIVNIDLVQRDKNQPRQILDQAHIEGLAKSIKIEGLINPIEVTPDMVIITGEMRWRAVRFLGWSEIKVNVNDSKFTEYEKLRHQMAENLHQSVGKTNMNPIDIAKAFKKLIRLKRSASFSRLRLSEDLGVSHGMIDEHLKLLEEPNFVLKDLQSGRPRTYYERASRVPVQFQESIKKKIASDGFSSREQITDFVHVSKLLPDLAKLQLESKLDKQSVSANRILNGITRLGLALEDCPLSEINNNEKIMVINQLVWILEKVKNYDDTQTN
jgi:ParB/RepB/Spo0J family partition protein